MCSFRKEDLYFINDLLDIIINHDLFLYICVFNKIEYIIIQLLNSFIYELKEFLNEIKNENQKEQKREMETSAIDQALILLEDSSADFSIDWNYKIAFWGFKNYLIETNINNYWIIIDWFRRMEVTDNLISLLISIVHKMHIRADKKVEKEILNEVKKVSGKTNILCKLAEASISNPEGVIKKVIYPIVGEETLKNIIKELKIQIQSTNIRFRQL